MFNNRNNCCCCCRCCRCCRCCCHMTPCPRQRFTCAGGNDFETFTGQNNFDASADFQQTAGYGSCRNNGMI